MAEIVLIRAIVISSGLILHREDCYGILGSSLDSYHDISRQCSRGHMHDANEQQA